MINTVAVATTNRTKFEQIASVLTQNCPGLTVTHEPLDIPEVQSLDIEYVAKEKVLYAWHKIKKPVLVDDGGFFLNAYHQFPGALSKFVIQGIGVDGLLTLAEKGNTGHFTTCIALCINEDEIYFFNGTMPGKLVEKPEHVTVNAEMPYRAYFVPEGFDKTYEELAHNGFDESFNHRAKAMAKVVSWFKGHG